MITVQFTAPENQKQGEELISQFEYWRQNPAFIVDRKYLFYKEIVEDDTLKIKVTNFTFQCKTTNPVIAETLKNQFQGIVL